MPWWEGPERQRAQIHGTKRFSLFQPQRATLQFGSNRTPCVCTPVPWLHPQYLVGCHGRVSAASLLPPATHVPRPHSMGRPPRLNPHSRPWQAAALLASSQSGPEACQYPRGPDMATATHFSLACPCPGGLSAIPPAAGLGDSPTPPPLRGQSMHFQDGNRRV